MSTTKYYIFSITQKKSMQEIARKMSRVYKGKFVIYGGKQKEFTSIVENPTISQYSDAIVVASGENLRVINEGELL